ncbi:MAG TPA: DinB family protein [Nitrolancea sp.]|nr:DinB family protein [Nitrolancea sp.]
MSEQDALLSAVRQGVSQVLREQHEAIRQTLAGLDTAALNWSPGPEMNSIAVIFTHMLGAEDAITATVLGEPIERDRDAEFRVHDVEPDRLAARAEQVGQRALDRIERLTAAQLEAFHTPPRDRLGRRFLGSWWIFHVLEHNREHIGQAGLTRQLYQEQANHS